MDETVNNTSNNETICTDTVPECTTGTAVCTQQINQKNDFDIVDFIISHSDEKSVRKKSKLPKILLCVILGVLIIGMCVMFAVWSSLSHKNKLWGTWQTSGGITMTITEKNITINGKTSEYIIEEKNVIAIKMNNEYYKIIYKLDGDSLTLTIPDESGVSELKYTRKSD